MTGRFRGAPRPRPRASRCPHSLGAPLLLHLGLGALRLVPHAGALQLAHQRQHLARRLIPPRPVDERAVGLEDEVGVLRGWNGARSPTLYVTIPVRSPTLYTLIPTCSPVYRPFTSLFPSLYPFTDPLCPCSHPFTRSPTLYVLIPIPLPIYRPLTPLSPPVHPVTDPLHRYSHPFTRLPTLYVAVPTRLPTLYTLIPVPLPPKPAGGGPEPLRGVRSALTAPV